jgi:DNA helicase-2/ATP-dependent DNA helicase PcrA
VVMADASRPSPFLDELAGVAPRQERPRPRPATMPARADPECEEALRAWRLDRSRADGVPAFVVFDNAVLRDLARARPMTLAALARVRGIGPAKLERYGAEVLAVLAGCASR